MNSAAANFSSLITELRLELWPWELIEVKDYAIHHYVYFTGFTFSDDILKRARNISRRHGFVITGFTVNLRRERLLIALILKEKMRRTK
jgi:hypothetical protein